jgi:hypothetical protein
VFRTPPQIEGTDATPAKQRSPSHQMLRVSHTRSAGVRSRASGGGLSGWFDGPDLADVRRYVALRRWQRADDLRDEPAADLLSPPL